VLEYGNKCHVICWVTQNRFFEFYQKREFDLITRGIYSVCLCHSKYLLHLSAVTSPTLLNTAVSNIICVISKKKKTALFVKFVH